MNMYVLMSCFMQRIKLVNPVTGETIPGQERGYGFFARETDAGLEYDYQQCSYYESDEIDVVFDGWVRSARFFSLVSEFLGTMAFLILINTCWCAFSEETFSRWIFWMYLLAAGAISLSFLIFGSEFCSDNRCKVAAGSGYALTTFMFWLSSCNTVKSIGGAMPKPPKDPNRPKKRRPWSKRKKGDDDEDLEQVMADMYYETEEDKYPIPECTAEGRARYAAAAAFADDTDPQANRQQQQEESDSDDSDDSDDSEYSDSDDSDKEMGPDGLMYDKNAGRDGIMHNGNGYHDDGYENNGYQDGYDEDPNAQGGIEMADYGQGGEPGYDEYNQGQGYDGYDQGQYDQGAAEGYDGYDQGQYDQGQEGYEGYGQGQYDQGQEGYDAYAQPGNDQSGAYDANAGYAQPGYEQGPRDPHGSYVDPAVTYDDNYQGVGYENENRPQVGDENGPTIT